MCYGFVVGWLLLQPLLWKCVVTFLGLERKGDYGEQTGSLLDSFAPGYRGSDSGFHDAVFARAA